MRRYIGLAAGLALTAAAPGAEERASTLKDQREVAVTIYNENLALVKDMRKVALDKGASGLAWRDVSARRTRCVK